MVFFQIKMSVSSGMSAVLSLTFALLTLAVMQVFRGPLASGKFMTIVGGFIGSVFFTFLLTVSYDYF